MSARSVDAANIGLMIALVGRSKIDQQKKANIPKRTAPMLLKFGVGLEHMYTVYQGL